MMRFDYHNYSLLIYGKNLQSVSEKFYDKNLQSVSKKFYDKRNLSGKVCMSFIHDFLDKSSAMNLVQQFYISHYN